MSDNIFKIVNEDDDKIILEIVNGDKSEMFIAEQSAMYIAEHPYIRKDWKYITVFSHQDYREYFITKGDGSFDGYFDSRSDYRFEANGYYGLLRDKVDDFLKKYSK